MSRIVLVTVRRRSPLAAIVRFFEFLGGLVLWGLTIGAVIFIVAHTFEIGDYIAERAAWPGHNAPLVVSDDDPPPLIPHGLRPANPLDIYTTDKGWFAANCDPAHYAFVWVDHAGARHCGGLALDVEPPCDDCKVVSVLN